MSTRFRTLIEALPIVPGSILELGCGDWDDYEWLRAQVPAGVLIGVDRVVTVTHRPGSIQADISRLPLHGCFDLIVIRHPDVHRSSTAWESVIRGLDGWLRPGGYALITTYTAPEYEMIAGWLPESLTVARLDSGLLAPVDLSGRDRFAFCLIQ